MTPTPATHSQRIETHALEYLQARGYYSTPYTEIVQPERVFAISHYFRNHWLPLLKPGPAWLVVGLRQRCFWNQQRDWCVISREQLATECGISGRTLDKYLDLPLISSWFLLEKVQRYRQMPDGQKQRDWKRYHVQLDEPLTPLHQAALTALARELQARCQATSPLAQALEVAEGLLALGAKELWQRLYAGEQDPTVQKAAQAVTCPCTPREIVEAVCMVEPTHRPDKPEEETHFAIGRACDVVYSRIVRPDKKQVASQYFRLNWMPVLGVAHAWLVMVLRARCYLNETDLVIRNTCTVHGGYPSLAASLGVSVKTIRRCLAPSSESIFLTKLGTRRPGQGKIEIDFRVEMIEPVTPTDQERYRLNTADQADKSATRTANQTDNFASSPTSQTDKSATRVASQADNFASSPTNQMDKLAGIWDQIKRTNLRNTKEPTSTLPSQEKNQQQQEHPSVLVAAGSSSELAQSQALNKLLELGFLPRSTAQRYATSHPPAQVIGWCEYALTEGLGAGYVRTMLDAGEFSPSVEEEPEHFVHVDYGQGERSLSPREVVMGQYGIEPETMDVWDMALGELRLQMTEATFDTWLRGSFLLSIADCAADGHTSAAQSAVIGVRNAHAVGWLQNRLAKTVQRTLARHLDVEADQLELVFEVLQKAVIAS